MDIKEKISQLQNHLRAENFKFVIDECNKLINKYPNNSFYYNLCGLALQASKNIQISIEYFKKSIDLDNKIAEPQNNLGNLYLALEKYKEAIACYMNAININPKFFVAHYNIGTAYINIGKIENAKKHLNEAVNLYPHFYMAHRVLSTITKYSKNNNHFYLLKKLYENSKIDNSQKTELAFALGKASEDIKDFKNAFQYYYKGNYLRRKEVTFSINNEKENFDNIKKVFNKNLFDKFKLIENLDSTPIFILGMPRSGTTLVEQILSNHPRVFGGDELDFLTVMVEKYFENRSAGLFLENIINIDKEDLKKIGQKYISELKKISGNSERVTDKLPINFKWVGLIKIILPNSRVIHCVRNSKDNCLSIFKNYFINPKLNFAYNLEEICGFYNLYSDLMTYWKNTLPKFVFDIQYEKIIDNPEHEIRNLLKICNLSWDDNCLKFYNNKRPIKTVSNVQVRKKIYKSSIDSWKNYAEYLRKIFKVLPN
jgi:tetratricopeptide (TPR) repeat protein